MVHKQVTHFSLDTTFPHVCYTAYRKIDHSSSINHIRSSVAQGKRAGLITLRSFDRNEVELTFNFLRLWWYIVYLDQSSLITISLVISHPSLHVVLSLNVYLPHAVW